MNPKVEEDDNKSEGEEENVPDTSRSTSSVTSLPSPTSQSESSLSLSGGTNSGSLDSSRGYQPKANNERHIHSALGVVEAKKKKSLFGSSKGKDGSAPSSPSSYLKGKKRDSEKSHDKKEEKEKEKKEKKKEKMEKRVKKEEDKDERKRASATSRKKSSSSADSTDSEYSIKNKGMRIPNPAQSSMHYLNKNLNRNRSLRVRHFHLPLFH